jgi:hypothetical protein
MIKNHEKAVLLVLMALMGLNLVAQNVSVSKARFKQGDDMSWAKPEMDDTSSLRSDGTTKAFHRTSGLTAGIAFT